MRIISAGEVESADGTDATLLLMPAWQPGRHIGIKLVTVFPDRAGRRFYDQITLFKSVGTAIEDLAAAQLTVERA